MQKLKASIGKYDAHDRECYAVITKRWEGTWPEFVDQLLKTVPVTDDKASKGWVCGAVFNRPRRHGKFFEARHFVSLDYDHIKPADLERILAAVPAGGAFLGYTTWSHVPGNPRIRVWLPLSRGVTADEYQAISRAVAARANIELAARESFTPAQFMFRPTRKDGVEFQRWINKDGPPVDADGVLAAYADWRDRSSWPHRSDETDIGKGEKAESPLEKPGVIGDFCRAFTITEAIERFSLPYVYASGERWTYTAGSRPEGAIVYDDDTKLHSHHDTDPASGQHNAFDLVRLHKFKDQDEFAEHLPVNERPSHKAMIALALQQPEVAALHTVAFEDLDKTEPLIQAPAPLVKAEMPERITRGASEYTDIGNARRIQRIYGDQIISVGKTFYYWNGTRWEPNNSIVYRRITELSPLVLDDAKKLAAQPLPSGEGAGERRDAELAAIYKWAIKCQGRGAVDNCEKFLRELLDVPGTKLNTHPHLLTCPNGTIDLRTSELLPNDRANFISACAPTPYDPAAKAPRWEKFLREIFSDDEALVTFAQRWFGYCTTGEVSESALVFHIGEGGNGKSVLMNTLQHVLGPQYTAKGARSLLATGSQRGATPEITDLFGKRMVTLSETGQDSAFDEALLKELSGADRLKGRELYASLFEFDPTHKLQIFTNYMPKVLGQDRGIWRRLFLLPYDVKFGRAEDVADGKAVKLQDIGLQATLAKEAPGILAWLVRGAKDWYANGLQPPPSVLARTDEFRYSQDLIEQFLRERTARDPSSRLLASGSGSLYEAYKSWATQMSYKPLGRNRFLEELKRIPYLKPERWEDHGTNCRGFRGIRFLESYLE